MERPRFIPTVYHASRCSYEKVGRFRLPMDLNMYLRFAAAHGVINFPFTSSS
ncbi:hypothetical protein HM1_1531 [Heliomicrobium modesticaldum Ice1]|uniref:Uncharacterized protein n=1 Tax=Heliobacterium modesticaldum (strain ATCC 51547 / Ice1) TaxID=498761 RepID=B0TCS8_HELMI|nr:hypothetical protein HM1_1531 [Heliomicrobium modesticaldum Ice1]